MDTIDKSVVLVLLFALFVLICFNKSDINRLRRVSTATIAHIDRTNNSIPLMAPNNIDKD